MSKLSESLKALINASAARPGPVPAPRNIEHIYERIAREASARRVGQPSWLAIATATTMTMNSSNSLAALYEVSVKAEQTLDRVKTAEFMREVGLKCIGFNGIPRTINMLGDFRSKLPLDVVAQLTTISSRVPTSQNLEKMRQRGDDLWTSIYRPFNSKLLDKLAESHPDLPVHIINSNYAVLFSDPDERPAGIRVGRLLTSLIAISALRAQSGVGPQVTSHIFGLRKSLKDGSWKAEEAEPAEGAMWLAGEDGNRWILETVDRIVAAISDGHGSTFAPLSKANL